MNVLPALVEIVPPAQPADATVVVPGSKSVTNRALILAALGDGTTTLSGALWSEDTRAMVDCLRVLGFTVTVTPGAREPANRTITVEGRGGALGAGGRPGEPLDLYVANAGTAARFLLALVCLGQGVYRLQGTPRMHERPQGPLIDALRSLGYRVDTANGRLPAVVQGGGRRPGHCRVSAAESSQFASGLLLAGGTAGWTVDVVDANPEELPYVEMTRALLRTFRAGGTFQVEPDASSGSYFWAAGALLGTRVNVDAWPASGWQIDEHFPARVPLPVELSRRRDLGDSIMTAIVLAPFAGHPVRFTDLGPLRLQECERVAALRTELTKCGARVREIGDTLEIEPGPLHGAQIATYDDHRMAMCFATLGLRVPGIRIEDPGCVRKTFPNFFQKLATPPPHGLGATIVDASSGRMVAIEELVAE